MANAEIRVKNTAKVSIHVEVLDMNDGDELVFSDDLDPQAESPMFEVKPHPENLDYQIEWKATALDHADKSDTPYVENGEAVCVSV